MAYDQTLAQRVRVILTPETGITGKKMFGGLAFMVRGNMCCGLVKDTLMLRLGDAASQALEQPHTRAMDFTGRPMKGFVYVEPEGIRTDQELRKWIKRAMQFAATLPPK